MRGIVIKVLDHLCIVGIVMAFATGVLGIVGASEPLFTVLAGTLIGLLGGATNLVILLAVLEVRRSIIMHHQVAIRVNVSHSTAEKQHKPIFITVPKAQSQQNILRFKKRFVKSEAENPLSTLLTGADDTPVHQASNRNSAQLH